MALRPHLWAMDDAPVDDPTAALILIALADEAADDGTGACPYIDKLIQRGRCSKRSVQNHLRDLFRARIINHGDPRVAMRRYGKSAGQAPRCWDLNLTAKRENTPTPRTDDEMRAEYSAMIGVKPLRATPATAEQSPADDAHDVGGVQILHPSESTGVQDLHLSNDQGKRESGLGGVQDLHPSESDGGVQPTAPFPPLTFLYPKTIPPA
jgi:hypothetical protein